MQEQSRSSLLPLAAAATLSAAALVLAAARKRSANKIRVESNSVRKPGQTSQVRIQTANAQLSWEFFTSFGLVEVSSSGPFILLSCPSPAATTRGRIQHQQPYILLEEIPPSEHPTSCRNCASDVGLDRLCLGVEDVYETVKILQEKHKLNPIASPVCDRLANPCSGGGNKKAEHSQPAQVVVAAYRDPASGVMLELVSIPSWAAKITSGVAQIVGSLKFPVFVHANVNVSNYKRGLATYQALGYTEIHKHYGQVKNNLSKALDIPEPAVAKEVTIIRTQNESPFCLELIEWEEHDSSQRSVSSGEQLHPMRLAFTVKDLPNELDRILSIKSNNNKPLWSLITAPKLRYLPPPLSKAIVATIADQDGIEVDIVEYAMITCNVNIRDGAQEKVVLITGCDSGFGRSLACRMSLLGFSVVAACYTTEGAQYLSQVATNTVAADLSRLEGVQDVVRAVKETLQGRQLWAIVNNAGVCYPGNVEWQRPELYQKAMQVNFHAPITIIHELIQHLKACAGSRILQVSSVQGLLPLPSSSAYCSTKSAIEAYSDCLRCELYPYDCHVVVLQPASMKTALGLSFWDSWYKGFQEAPLERRTSFRSDKIEHFVAMSSQLIQEAAEDPDLVTTAMVKALLEPRPPTRLRVGLVAELFFKPVSCLPDKTRDSILWNMLKFDEIHVAVKGEQKA